MNDDSLNLPTSGPAPLRVHVEGRADHPDFADAIELLRAGATLVQNDEHPPELTIIAQRHPGEISHADVELIRHRAPLSGFVALVGSWCEGETRTGKPWPGIPRLYWHEFPAWWRRQLALRAVGRCPDWTQAGDFGFRIADCGLIDSGIRNPQSAIRNQSAGVILLRTSTRETFAAIADALQRAGFATVWQPAGRRWPVVHGAAAGIWDGGQLDDREAGDLAVFCRSVAGAHAPVIALLDFPRRDRVEYALALGAATVLGKPWLNGDLVATINCQVKPGAPSMEPPIPRAA
jgi:hypothetical protein